MPQKRQHTRNSYPHPQIQVSAGLCLRTTRSWLLCWLPSWELDVTDAAASALLCTDLEDRFFFKALRWFSLVVEEYFASLLERLGIERKAPPGDFDDTEFDLEVFLLDRLGVEGTASLFPSLFEEALFTFFSDRCGESTERSFSFWD